MIRTIMAAYVIGSMVVMLAVAVRGLVLLAEGRPVPLMLVVFAACALAGWLVPVRNHRR